jgi:putative transposase
MQLERFENLPGSNGVSGRWRQSEDRRADGSKKANGMPRLERLDFNGAIHHVRIRGREGSQIFFDAIELRRSPKAPRHNTPNLRKFEDLIDATCEEYGVRLHAYCVEPNSCILVLPRCGAPLDSFMGRLCGRYSRYLRAGDFGKKTPVFGSRYESKVIAPEYLPHAVRRAHYSPVLAGLCMSRVDYPFSSERAYVGESSTVRLDTLAVRAALEQKGYFALHGYRRFMDQAETPYVAKLFARGAPTDPRIVGSKVYVQQARSMAAHPPEHPTREQLIAGVARLLNTTPAEIYSATHIGVLGRSLVAWYGRRNGAATLTEMGRWFSVTGATLGQGMRIQRGLTPDLFKVAILPGFEQSESEPS